MRRGEGIAVGGFANADAIEMISVRVVIVPPSKDVVGGQEARLAVADDLADECFVAFIELGRY
jgi:hypothetical protein